MVEGFDETREEDRKLYLAIVVYTCMNNLPDFALLGKELYLLFAFTSASLLKSRSTI